MSASEQRLKGQRLIQQLEGGRTTNELIDTMKEVFPAFGQMEEEYVFGEIWTRPRLGVRDRILITLAALIVLNYTEGLKTYMRYALNNGITKEEIQEILMHLAQYSGYASSVNALFVAQDVCYPEK